MSEYRLEVRGVTKVFPGTRALDQVQLQVRPGEVHALCGENGAGKSTLMNIIGGVFPPTEGEILFEGAPIAPRNPKEAQDIGIGFVHQELSLCPHLTAAENIFIGRLPHKGGMIDFKRLWADADMVLKQFNANFPSSALVSELTVSEQQIIEIAKSVSLNCKLLILDEPTSSLTEKETARLFDLVKELSGRGISILYISHRMAEIFEICDRVTVFKDGTYVTTMDTGDICADDIIRAMVGRELGNLYPTKSSCIAADDPVLEVNGLTGSIFREVSFALRRGEILGFAGLVGAGRSEVMRGLCAIDPIRSGQVVLNGRPCAFHTYRDAVDAGICYLTEDRKTQGLFLEMSIKNNMSSANMKGVSHGIWLDDKLERSLANGFVEQLAIKIPGIEYCADDIIRAMVGRELGNLYPTKSSCIAADDPVLEVNGLTGSIFREVSFALRRGEILGFAGLVGAGRSEVMRGLCAIDPIRSGQVVLNGRPCAFHTYRDAVDAGICYLTEDRKTQGLFLEMSIKNNMSSANMKGVSHGIWLDDKLERSLANGFVEQLAIKIPGIEYPISSLSGGNQQKCLIGKWLSLAPKVIIMDEPTRGIDVGAKREIHALLRQLAESGVGVIVVSSELPEVIGVSDRVAVMHEGCLAGFLEGEEVTEENIMKLASGEQLAEKELRQ